MTELKIRKALPGDLDTIMRIYRNAQEFMISVGNPTQWGHFYPEEDMITEDIEKGISLVIYDDSGVHGVFALCEGDEPSYEVVNITLHFSYTKFPKQPYPSLNHSTSFS